MGLFNSILEKIGLGQAHAAPDSTAPTTPPEASTGGAGAPTGPAVDQVDVAAKLDSMAQNHPEKLNWRTSIVDLLKLLGLDSSLTARKELATELGCPADKMGDSAQMNMWLHKAVLNKLAENGGNVPADLLD
ncbi:DUF3597 domain-containing protein [Stutzerimonas kunmingensis]|jgi:hypothetical protein|uniref:DUF3597 domain-containing protein n=1 Tax=Stutzerimonas kunmingensis TaxID=1211807 RepID=UPI000C4E22E8|nr:DUF3597 domain-containing protein [Stutzerimonas kunmingensis]MAK85732.1 oxidoreductase [Pseudomonas sp.]MBD3875896.1 DUF3597 domain-containing protein [Stutzerimonas kunmingensis]PKM12209.1 MAG: oxidoreductase [Gammaproteobacteria bacterium HGW-Gammaproteobacteria-5]|tara:strand:+ start:580 stop:975 length:396 start_codon:yes stop_codon:yes gene_type:complete